MKKYLQFFTICAVTLMLAVSIQVQAGTIASDPL